MNHGGSYVDVRKPTYGKKPEVPAKAYRTAVAGIRECTRGAPPALYRTRRLLTRGARVICHRRNTPFIRSWRTEGRLAVDAAASQDDQEDDDDDDDDESRVLRGFLNTFSQ